MIGVLLNVDHYLRCDWNVATATATVTATATTGGRGCASDAANCPANSAALLRGVVDDGRLLGRGSLRCLREHGLIVQPFGLKLVVVALICLVSFELHLCHLQFVITLCISFLLIALCISFLLFALRFGLPFTLPLRCSRFHLHHLQLHARSLGELARYSDLDLLRRNWYGLCDGLTLRDSVENGFLLLFELARVQHASILQLF